MRHGGRGAGDLTELLAGPAPARIPVRDAPPDGLLVIEADRGGPPHPDYLALRRREFVDRQALFTGTDRDGHDGDPHTVTLLARSGRGEVLGGVRIHPAAAELGWWRGSRLVTRPGPGRGAVGAALVRAAVARAHAEGALRFDAHVQSRHRPFFAGLGWVAVGQTEVAGTAHAVMRSPVTRLGDHALAHKRELGGLLGGLLPRDRWLGDDGVPVPGLPGSVVCVDAITPSMVERDPEWAGWCGMLVTAGDLSAMGAERLGALDAVAGRDAGHVARVIAGLRAGADAFGLPVLGGHTQTGVPAALSVTGIGRADHPVPGGGGRPGDALWLCADLAGGWRPGYTGRQWDSTSHRRGEDLRAMLGVVARTRPHAAKDVSMAGLAGTIGMLAEASGCGARIDLAAVPRPAAAGLADWLGCFPGFAVVLALAPGASPPDDAGGRLAARRIGTLTSRAGVRLAWPDGEETAALADRHVTGLGPAAAPGTGRG